ncbi:hypothetical protein D9M69_735900 [compost metagenome]
MVQQALFLADQAFRVAVIGGRHIQLEPLDARYQVSGEYHRPTGHRDFRQQLPRCVAIAEVKPPTGAQHVAAGPIKQL